MLSVMYVSIILIAGEEPFFQKLFITGIGKQKEKQVVEEGHKACENNGEYDQAIETACEQFNIMRVVYNHIKKGKDGGSGERESVGNLQKSHSAVHMPVEEKGEEKKHKGQNIAGFHAGCLHQCPGG